ncbi:hypothetical protein QL285_025140 [Trifolium repens]|nr:hypothetical protein QL285_025140 [Trifolium repens]
MGALKCNVDTSCYSELNIYGIWECVRDAHGKFVRAYTRRFEGKLEKAEAEALAILEALQWLHNVDISNVHIEVDCLQVVKAISNKLRNNTEFDIIIELCRSLLNMIQNCKVMLRDKPIE